ncbi:MAG: hypothetical protein LAO07_05980, partial [Acidobacteriia bacterium]|nr:hypothetical protein [Terriglobia bacterium]
GPPNWTHFNDFWRMFSREGAVMVSSTYTRVGGLYDGGFLRRSSGTCGSPHASTAYRHARPRVYRAGKAGQAGGDSNSGHRRE